MGSKKLPPAKAYRYFCRCPKCGGRAFEYKSRPKNTQQIEPADIVQHRSVVKEQQDGSKLIACRTCGEPIENIQISKSLIIVRIGSKKDPTKREWRWWENDDGSESAKMGKLEEAFLMGCTDEEACYYADISIDQLTYYQETHPDFAKRKKLLKEKPILTARRKVVSSLESDKNFAFEFLKVKKKAEFAPKIEIENSGASDATTQLAELLRNTDDKTRHEFTDLIGRLIEGAAEGSDLPAEPSEADHE